MPTNNLEDKTLANLIFNMSCDDLRLNMAKMGLTKEQSVEFLLNIGIDLEDVIKAFFEDTNLNVILQLLNNIELEELQEKLNEERILEAVFYHAGTLYSYKEAINATVDEVIHDDN